MVWYGMYSDKWRDNDINVKIKKTGGKDSVSFARPREIFKVGSSIPPLLRHNRPSSGFCEEAAE